MKMVPLDIVDGSYKDEDLSFSAQDTVNYLPTVAEQNGTRTPTMLRTCPGLKPSVAVGVNDGAFSLAGPIRNTYNAEGRFFVVAGNTLYQITTAGISVPLGTVPGVGRVSFSHNQITNGNQILVNNGNAGYIYNTVTQLFERITDTGYPGGLRAVFINNRFVQIEPARRYLFNSDLADGLEYNALDRFTSETSPDLVMGIESIGNQLAVFSSTTTEWFEDTGANPQPFRSTGIVADKGAAGPFCTAKLDNQLFFLADDGVFYRYQGYNPVRISTKPIEQAIRNKNWFNAFTTTWEDSGYAVCYWTFPDGQTWGYDASTNKWHRRESYGFNRWRLNSLTYWRNRWYGGDFQAGKLYQLDWDYILEGDQEIESIRACGVVSDNQNRVIHERLELVMNTGMVETVPVAFGTQPEGPSITGTPPGGSVGIPYAGYTFTVTPGDAPIARTIILSGSLPPGLTWNQNTASISATTPTALGLFPFTLRTIDTNGLYADLEVEIVISMVTLAMYSTVGVTSESYQLTDGITWGAWTAESLLNGQNQAVATSTAWVTFGVSGAPTRKPIVGAFAASTGTAQSGVGGFRNGAVNRNTGTIILTQGLATPATRSTNDGVSFAPCGLTGINSVMHIPNIERWIGIRGIDMDAYLSNDDGVTESLAFDIPDSSSAVGLCSFGIDDFGYIGASSSFPYSRKLWRTDGTSLAEVPLTSGPGEAVFGIGGGYCSGVLRLVCWTEAGELFVRDPDTEDWSLADDQPDGIPFSVTSNGAMLIMSVNKDNPSDNEGIEQTSTDGNTWTERLRTTIGDTEGFSAVSALLEPA